MVGDGKNWILLLYPRKLSNVLKLLTFSRYTPFLMVQIAIRITRGLAGLVSFFSLWGSLGVHSFIVFNFCINFWEFQNRASDFGILKKFRPYRPYALVYYTYCSCCRVTIIQRYRVWILTMVFQKNKTVSSLQNTRKQCPVY